MCRMIAWASLALLLAVSATPTREAGGNKIPDDILAVLENAEHFQLLALADFKGKDKDVPADTLFYGYRVTQRVMVKDAAVRAKLVAALKKGVADNKEGGAKCFDPGHAIRAIHEGKTVDLVICFKCFRVQAYFKGTGDQFFTTESPQLLFNEVLAEARK